MWHSSLTLENRQDLERVQKNALKIILGDGYIDYESALTATGLDSLNDRRNKLCLRFAESSLKNQQTCDMFPFNTNRTNVSTRKPETFQVTPANTERLKTSAIPFMQRLLNAKY